MFIGHIAVGFTGKSVVPDMKIGTSILAATMIDLLFSLFLIAGLERVRIVPGFTAAVPLDLEYYPWSHGLIAAVLWSALAGAVYYLVTKSRRGSLWISFAVFSHWILDLVSHSPDLPLWWGGPKIGLGLWNSVPGTMAVELFLFAAGVFLYWRAIRARSVWGHISLWGTVALLTLLFIASFFAPPPPSADAFKWSALQGLCVVLLGYVMDRTRKNRGNA